MKILLLLLIALISHGASYAQSSLTADLIDEFPVAMCSDDLRNRIDNFFNNIVHEPGSVGSVVVTPDRSIPGKALKYRRIIENHVGFRQFDPNRISFSQTPWGESRIQFWIYPKGVPPPTQPVSEPWLVSDTTLFDASGIYVSPWDRKINFGEYSDEPCDFGLSFDQFAGVLKADGDLTANLLFSSGNRFSRTKAHTALKIALKQLKDLGVAPDRLTARYVGRRKKAEMQLWLVPKGAKRPVFREGTLSW